MWSATLAVPLKPVVSSVPEVCLGAITLQSEHRLATKVELGRDKGEPSGWVEFAGDRPLSILVVAQEERRIMNVLAEALHRIGTAVAGCS